MMTRQKPAFLTAPPEQPPVDPRFRAIAEAARTSLYEAARYLIGLPPFPTEQEKSVWMWHTALATLAWDVADITIPAAAESSSLRGARALNRMLLEYAARVHLYIVDPPLAQVHMSEAANMLRRVMKPVAGAPLTDPGIGDIRKFVSSGTTKATQPKTDVMFDAMVSTFVKDPTKRPEFVAYLEADYAMGNAYVHGSQTAFFDIFDGGKGQLNPRTRVLHRQAEVMRCTNCMIALLGGLEIRYGQDFGAGRHVASLSALGPYDTITSMGTHDTLMKLLGIG